MSCGECRTRRRDKVRLWLIIALMVSNVLLFASNALWLHVWMQYDNVEETTTVTVDAADGIASYIGRDGIVNGDGEGHNEEEVPDEAGEQGHQNEEMRNADH